MMWQHYRNTDTGEIVTFLFLSVHFGKKQVIAHLVENTFISEYKRFTAMPVQDLVQRWPLDDAALTFEKVEPPQSTFEDMFKIFVLYKGLPEKALCKVSSRLPIRISGRRMVMEELRQKKAHLLAMKSQADKSAVMEAAEKRRKQREATQLEKERERAKEMRDTRLCQESSKNDDLFFSKLCVAYRSGHAIDLDSHSVLILRKLCKEFDIKQIGRKDDIVERLTADLTKR
jgi:hypothetical protein